MSAESELAASLARYDTISREFADRRALRDRELAKASAELKERFAKQGATVQQMAERYRELGARQRKAGGWSTTVTVEGRQEYFSFAARPESAYGSVSPSPSIQAPAAAQPPVQDGVDEDDFSNQKWMR